MRNRGAANAPKAAAARPTRSNFRRRGAKTVGAGYNWIRDIDGVRNMRRSILLVDAAAGTLRHGAAPHLPDAYNRAIDGTVFGKGVGSCGTAAHRRSLVVVSDIQKSPRARSG